MSVHEYPFGHDALAFQKVIVTFVKKYVDLYYLDDQAIYEDEELIEFWDGLRGNVDGSHITELTGKQSVVGALSLFIIHVTGYHNQAGNVADYLVNPTFSSPKIRKGRNMADVQATFQGLNIGLMTAIKAPKLMSDFKHLCLEDEKKMDCHNILDEFQKELKSLSGKIDQWNKERKMPCNAFNPKIMTSSVSI